MSNATQEAAAPSQQEALEKGMEVEETHEYLTFALGDEEYGIPILKVQEIIGYQKSTPIPNAPPWVSGAINIRGVVIPVIDVREVFTMPAIEYNMLSVIIITQVEERVLGMVVDGVNDVLGFTNAQLQEAPDVSSHIRTEFIEGVGKMDERLVLLLNMDEMLERALAETPENYDEINMIKAKKAAKMKKVGQQAQDAFASADEIAQAVESDQAGKTAAMAETIGAQPEVRAEAQPEAGATPETGDAPAAEPESGSDPA